MLFNSYEFLFFIACVLPLYYRLPHKWQNRFLIFASYFFYGWWDWRFCGLILVSTLVDYFVGLALEASAKTSIRRRFLWISIGTNLGLLGTFKYFDFFAESAAEALSALGMSADFVTLNVVLPVGISFYTFQTMSYTIDVYRRQTRATRDFESFALFVSYFPQLVAGPIERSTRLLPQISAPRRVTSELVSSGSVLILIGYFKKVAVADAVAPLVDRAFSSPDSFGGTTLLFAVYLFALQIYCDFSGYSDIARGISRLMGIELMENFRQPYFSANITEFWRRWHISLSRWLRDYLYISLGGNRHGQWKMYRNLLMTMVLGGLWHGAGWTFVLWGSLHGVYLAIHKWILGRRRVTTESRTTRWIPQLLSVIGTFHLVCLAWIFFRSPDIVSAWSFLWGIFANGGAPLPGFVLNAVIYGSAILLLDGNAWWQKAETPFSEKTPLVLRGAAYGVMVSMCLWVGNSSAVPFIYFQF